MVMTVSAPLTSPSLSESPSLELSVKGMRKSFGTKKILQGLDLNIKTGKSLVILGGSGSGKSVFLKCILGLMTPDKGSVHINGENVTDLRGKARMHFMRRFGVLFQASSLFDSLKVWENIAFRLLNADGIPKKLAHKRAIAALEQVNLPRETANLFPSELSGGMQKRVGLARAIVSKPKMIFFDEPTSGLDPISSSIINDLIVRQVKALGAAAITITHDMSSARKIADEVALLHKGHFVWQGPAEQLDTSGNPYVEQFVRGESEGPIKAEI